MPMLLALLLLAQNADPVHIEARWDGKTCTVRVDGAPAPLEGLEEPARGWAMQGRPVRITGDADTPYRCIGGTIYALQMAGFAGNMPDPAVPGLELHLAATIRFVVPPGKCRAFVNDMPVSDARLDALATDWHRYQPEIHFQPHPDAEYACVDKALGVVKRAGVSKLGFVGNEQYEDPDAP